MSKMLQVRNVPDDVHAKLRARAASAGMSLSEYTLRRLTADVERPTVDELFALGAAHRSSITADEVLAALDEGRAQR